MKQIYCTAYQAPWIKGRECRIDFCVAESVNEANTKFTEKYSEQRLIVHHPSSTKAISETGLLEGYKISLEKIV